MIVTNKKITFNIQLINLLISYADVAGALWMWPRPHVVITYSVLSYDLCYEILRYSKFFFSSHLLNNIGSTEMLRYSGFGNPAV